MFRVRLVPVPIAARVVQGGAVVDAGRVAAARPRLHAHRRVQRVRHGRPLRALRIPRGRRTPQREQHSVIISLNTIVLGSNPAQRNI